VERMDRVPTEGARDPVRARYGPATVLVERLFSRLRMLSGADLERAVGRWRALVGPAWFAAERALGHSTAVRRRRAERYRALQRLHELAGRRRRLDDPAPGDDPASEAGAQYVVTTAVLALLVRDDLPEDHFALLYAPMAELAPLHELGYDLPRPAGLGLRAVLGDAPPEDAPSAAE
jgi:hypothetical protein